MKIFAKKDISTYLDSLNVRYGNENRDEVLLFPPWAWLLSVLISLSFYSWNLLMGLILLSVVSILFTQRGNIIAAFKGYDSIYQMVIEVTQILFYIGIPCIFFSSLVIIYVIEQYIFERFVLDNKE